MTPVGCGLVWGWLRSTERHLPLQRRTRGREWYWAGEGQQGRRRLASMCIAVLRVLLPCDLLVGWPLGLWLAAGHGALPGLCHLVRDQGAPGASQGRQPNSPPPTSPRGRHV